MDKLVDKIQVWIYRNKLEFFLLVLILLVGAFMRLYKINEYMTFLGDEGRDAIIVRNFITKGDLMLIGPGTSVGNMYLGPLYYYMMAPALLLANFSPVGPAIQIALLGIATIFLIWYVGREWFPTLKINYGALISAFLYAISPVVIVYSRSSWNPNIMPFFALLSIYAIWRVWAKYEYNWLIVLGISFAFVLQSHYLGLLLVPTLVLFWLVSVNKKIVKPTLIGTGIFVFLMSPLLIFDARHGWPNSRALVSFFSARQQTVSLNLLNAIPKIPTILAQITERLMNGTVVGLGMITAIILAGLVIYTYKNNRKPYLLLTAWLGFALIGFGLYKQPIYDHYFGFVFAVPYLFLAGIMASIFEGRIMWLKYILGIAVVVLVILNLVKNPLRNAPNQQMQRAQTVAAKITQEADGQRFNLAVIAGTNYEDGYQYFLERTNQPVVEIDAQKASTTITNQLFVVCELTEDKCNPTTNPKAQVADFGWSRIDGKWQVSGAILYKLVHTQ
jgi:4-amino-4-deoxy-L-arabinose transferase-like glycosyltransferase